MATTSTTAPLIQAPSAKEKKYDRQLRLWAASGQRALEESHVLLVVPDQGENGSGTSVAGVETLKNLVLPGIGSFTIADSATVQEADLGVNFFLDEKSLGKSRAEECKKLLQELNPDVEGHVITLKLDGWPTGTAALRPYNLILLCSPMPMHILNMISKYAHEQPVPVVYIHSRGFYGSFSVQLPEEFPIVETHPDPESIQDLRLLAPFPELQKELSRIGNIENLNDDDHGHIPWLVILLYYLEEWKISPGNKLPHTFKEKTAFRDFVRSKARTDNSEGGEENFDEAVSAVLKTVTPPSVGSGCREMFEMDSCSKLRVETANFWIIASAIKTFHKRHGVLPLPGSLPDMKARSQDYIQLQHVYKKKARDDVAEVLETVRTTEKALSRNSSPIPYEEVEAFCKNASHVKVVRGRTLAQARLFVPSNSPAQKEDLPTRAVDPDDDDEEQDPSFASLLPIFVALLASEYSLKDGALIRFFGENIKFFQLTPRQMNACVGLVRELSNARGGELHNIGSIMGGMVAQEVIKILTRQYVPVNGTCVFDGVQGRTEILHI